MGDISQGYSLIRIIMHLVDLVKETPCETLKVSHLSI